MTTARRTTPAKPRKPAAKPSPAPATPVAPPAPSIRTAPVPSVRVGDRFALPVPDCGALPLTWLVVSVLPDHPDAVLLVPCDPVPLLGPHDAPHPDGDTFARCRGATWASATKLFAAEHVPTGNDWRALAKHCRGIIHAAVMGDRLPVTKKQVETAKAFNYVALLLAVKTVGREVNRLYS